MELTQDLIDEINTRLLFDLPPMRSECALVFGQGVYSLLLAPEIAKGFLQQRYKRIVISGGAEVLRTPDADLLMHFFQAAGVPPATLPQQGEIEADYIVRLLPPAIREHCVLERQGTNTGENVELYAFAANSMTSEFRKLQEYEAAGFIVPVDLNAERNAIIQSGLAITL